MIANQGLHSEGRTSRFSTKIQTRSLSSLRHYGSGRLKHRYSLRMMLLCLLLPVKSFAAGDSEAARRARFDLGKMFRGLFRSAGDSAAAGSRRLHESPTE
jgi:hypothetical protein